MPLRAKLAQLDFLGTSALVPGITCVLLALRKPFPHAANEDMVTDVDAEWGGTTYPWSNGRIIALLVIGAALVVVFALVQVLKPDTATVPPRIFMQRSILAGFWATFCIGSHMMVFGRHAPTGGLRWKRKTLTRNADSLLPAHLVPGHKRRSGC